MAFQVITLSMLQARLGPSVVNQILDDDNSGTPNTAAVNQLLSDGQARFFGYMRRAYQPAEIALYLAMVPPPELMVTLCLDVCQALAFERFPTYCRFDGATLLMRVQKDLEAMAMSKLRFDGVTGNAQDPIPQNVGGIVESGNPNSPAPPPAVFMNGMGDF